MKKRTSALLCGALILLFLGAVWALAPKAKDDGVITLRVLVEKQDAYDLNIRNGAIDKAILDAAAQYEASHENIRIELEYIPNYVTGTGQEDRRLFVQHIQNEILGGGGPDIFLTAVNTILVDGWEGVFTDVEGSMRDGLFYDVSGWFDTDEELQGVLEPAVMAAGRLGDGQYVLPMRYTYPVVFVDQAAADAAGLDFESLCADPFGLYDTMLSMKDPGWYRGGLRPSYGSTTLCWFPEIVDYETSSVLLPLDQVAVYAGYYQATSGASPSAPYVAYYINYKEYPLGIYQNHYNGSEVDVHAYLGELNGVIGFTAVGKMKRSVDGAAYPLRDLNGDLTATVTYWGALSTNTKHPAEAYDFLRLMLMPEAQNVVAESDGWPVRTDVTFETLWPNYLKEIEKYRRRLGTRTFWQEAKERAERLKKVELTNSDFPLAGVEIDRARFCTYTEYCCGGDLFWNEGGPEAAAEELYEKFFWHMAER